MLHVFAEKQHTTLEAYRKEWIMRLLFITVLFALALPAAAQIYQYTDAQGQPVFTDQPPPGVKVEKVDLGPINSASVPRSSILNTASHADKISEHLAPYSQLQLTGLPANQAIRANDGSFTVNVAISPSLNQQHRLQLMVDGQAYGTASTATQFALHNIDRGEHRLAVQVIANGQVIQRSVEQIIHIQRAHIKHPKPADQ